MIQGKIPEMLTTDFAIASVDTYGGHIPVGFDITSSGLYIVIYDANATDKVSHSTFYSVYDDVVTQL